MDRRLEEHAIVRKAEARYHEWLAKHPDATALEQLAEIYRIGQMILRREL